MRSTRPLHGVGMVFVLTRTVFVSLLLAAMGVLAGWWSHDVTKRETGVELTGEATLLAEHAARSIEGIDLTLRELVREVEAEWGKGRAPTAAFHEVLKGWVGAPPQVAGLRLANARGELIADQTASQSGTTFVGDRAYFRSHSGGTMNGRLFLGDPVRGPITGKVYFTASRGLRTPRGVFGGVVAATFDPFYYRRFHERLVPSGKDQDVALVDDGGTILAGSIRLSSGGRVPLRESIGKGAETPSGRSDVMILPLGAGADAFIAHLVRVPGFPFYAFVGQPRLSAFGGWWVVVAGLAGVWFMGTLGSAAAFYSIWRRETQRQAAFTAMERANREASTALERAEAASAAKSRFLAHMSHELRTPLNAILGFSEVIRDGMIGAGGNRDSEYAGLIHQSGTHLLQIINDLLDLSKIEAGKLELHPEPLDLDALVASAETMVSHDLGDRRVALITKLPDPVPPLFADHKAGKQMLVNLISNAVKFSPPGATVEVSASSLDDGGVRVTISDRGRGIPEDKLASVYEPFSQAAVDISDAKQGTGLGLPLVKSLIELHGGHIALASSLGEGTEVTLYFPPSRAA